MDRGINATGTTRSRTGGAEMFLRIWRFITLILVALFVGLEFCHVLELPAKLQYRGGLYVTLQNSLYRYFGFPGPGAWITMGALLSTVVLLFLVRRRHPARNWTLGGLICVAIAFPLVFFQVIEPVNIIIEQATPASLPANWEQLRQQWESGHALNFGLGLVALSLLLISVIGETPAAVRDRRLQ